MCLDRVTNIEFRCGQGCPEEPKCGACVCRDDRNGSGSRFRLVCACFDRQLDLYAALWWTRRVPLTSLWVPALIQRCHNPEIQMPKKLSLIRLDGLLH
jgi:hypothetical protein